MSNCQLILVNLRKKERGEYENLKQKKEDTRSNLSDLMNTSQDYLNDREIQDLVLQLVEMNQEILVLRIHSNLSL